MMDQYNGWGIESRGHAIHTEDGGRTWVIYHYVTWDTAEFDFINKDIGWAIVTIGDQTALVYTEETGDSWQELLLKIVELTDH